MQLPERVVKPSMSTKYLGVIFDQNLSWRAQQAHIIKKGTIWAVQIRCIVKQAWGVTPKYARQLYISITLPRALYAVDLWCIPTQSVIEGNHPGPKAILLREGRPTCTLHFHLGLEGKHTVHEAELVGILLGLQLISTEKKGSTTFALGSDNQAAIKAFHSNLWSPGHHLAQEALHLAQQIQNHNKKTKFMLMIRWMAGHKGIEGNEIIDREAKRVAEGHASDKKLLPVYLRKPLLTNPSAVKREFNDQLKNTWDSNWQKSDRGSKMHQIDAVKAY